MYLEKGGKLDLKEENIEDNPLNFLMKNYKTLSNLKSSFRIMEIKEEKLKDHQDSLFFIAGGIHLVSLIILLITVYLVRKNILFLHKIFKIYTFLPDHSIGQKITEALEDAKELCSFLPKDSNHKM